MEWFNRTFMELKYALTSLAQTKADGFNRTFMELKLYCQTFVNTYLRGLIVPLWN